MISAETFIVKRFYIARSVSIFLKVIFLCIQDPSPPPNNFMTDPLRNLLWGLGNSEATFKFEPHRPVNSGISSLGEIFSALRFVFNLGEAENTLPYF